MAPGAGKGALPEADRCAGFFQAARSYRSISHLIIARRSARGPLPAFSDAPHYLTR